MLGGTNDFSCWSLPPPAALGLRPRRVGQLAAPFPGDFGEFGAAFPRHFGEFGTRSRSSGPRSRATSASRAAFAGLRRVGGRVRGRLRRVRGRVRGRLRRFVAAFPRDVCQFAAPLGADLESTAQLVSERAVGERTARRSPDGQRGGHGLRHVAGRVSAAQPSDGLPSVSTAAMISPPMRLTSARKARRSSALRCGSASFQNIFPPRLPGITLSARVADANRGILPVAKSSPPSIWTAPLMRATVSALNGTFGPTAWPAVRSGRWW